MSFGNNIKKCRLDKGINQKEFAKILGIPVSTLANYENNHREPKTEILIKIADALLIPIDELLDSETTSFSSNLITSMLQMEHITIVDASEEYGFKAISRDSGVNINYLRNCIEENIELAIEDQLNLLNFGVNINHGMMELNLKILFVRMKRKLTKILLYLRK